MARRLVIEDIGVPHAQIGRRLNLSNSTIAPALSSGEMRRRAEIARGCWNVIMELGTCRIRRREKIEDHDLGDARFAVAEKPTRNRRIGWPRNPDAARLCLRLAVSPARPIASSGKCKPFATRFAYSAALPGERCDPSNIFPSRAMMDGDAGHGPFFHSVSSRYCMRARLVLEALATSLGCLGKNRSPKMLPGARGIAGLRE